MRVSMCGNEMGRGLALRPVIVGASHDLKGDSWGYFCQRPTAKGVGLRVANSHSRNHPEDGFAPLKTIRRLLVAIGRRSHSGFKGDNFEPERRASNDFATATFSWLDEFIADAASPIEALLSKKPPVLQKPAPLRT
ncbi:hypothetical protein Tco_1271901 [Tanacetum coccineum]